MNLVEMACKKAELVLSKSMPRRWCHVEGVGRRAEVCTGLFAKSDAKVLVAAAYLHDIGYAPSVTSTGFHALDGAEYLQRHGFPERVCALVAYHSCAYLEAELRGLTAELQSWSDEATSVRDALWWADMTTGPDGAVINVVDRIEEIQKRYGPEDLVTFFIRQAKSELVAAVERTEVRLRAAGIDYTAK